MENNYSTPKDVLLTSIESSSVYADAVFGGDSIFEVSNIIIETEQQAPVNFDTNNGYFTRRYAPEYIVTLEGKMLKNIKLELLDFVSFVIRIRRMDIIEIIKYGQYITIKGVGIPTTIEWSSQGITLFKIRLTSDPIIK